MQLDPIDIISEFYDPASRAFEILVAHSRKVAQKALEAAGRVPHLNPDLAFIEEAAMLHDIGVFLTDAGSIGCTGTEPYVRHGWLGGALLEKKGLSRHALVCERHTGAGISKEEIVRNGLPLPRRDMRPVSIEEILICYADKFFSKSKTGKKDVEKPIPNILRSLSAHGAEKAETFLTWHHQFGGSKLPCDRTI